MSYARGATPLPIADADPGQVAPGLPDTPESAAILAMIAAQNDDGSVTLTPPATGLDIDPRDVPWGDNLAEHLPDAVLGMLADEVIENTRADIASNADHYRTLTDGIESLGLKVERLDTPFKGAAGARSSLLLRSVMRFNATAMGEMMPAAGPVRVQIQGDAPGIDAAATRKQKYLNHYLVHEDEGYYPDRDQGLMLLGLFGSTFRMVYRDPYDGKPKSRFRTPFNLVVSYHASDLHHGGRFTEIDKLPMSEVKRLQVIGHWRSEPLATPSGDAADDAGDTLRQAEGRQASDQQEDAEHTIYTQRVITEIPGMEHRDADGDPTGLPLPWRVTVDLDSRHVLRIDRDWDADDVALRPREHFAHERYAPGLGYYGIGFAHLLASSQDAGTTLIRQGLNANTLVSFPGGLMVKGARNDQNDVAIGPCEFRPVDTGGMKIGDAVMPLPYKDVPPSFVPLMQAIQADGEQLGQVAEMQVGEGRQDAPVGTTLAIIEQAVRVESAVIKRLHSAQAKELRLLAKLFGEDQGAVYPYHIGGKEGVPLAPDFAGSSFADIVPTSDPNVPTQTARLSMAQAKLSLAQAAPPGMFDLREAHLGMLRVAGTDDAEIERLMPPPKRGTPMDPLSEMAAAMQGEPLAVHPMQLHAAHITAHLAQAQTPNLPPPIVQSLMSHIGEHLAQHMHMLVSQQLGVQLPPLGTQLPPQIEHQLAAAYAPIAGQITAQIAPLLAGPGEKADPHKAEELRIKAEALRLKAEADERKALAQARQDQGEMIQAQQEAEDADRDRALSYDEMAHEERMQRMEMAMRGMEHEQETHGALRDHALSRAAQHEDAAHEERMSADQRRHDKQMAEAQRKAAAQAAKDKAKAATSKPKAGLG